MKNNTITAPQGFMAGAAACGIKGNGKLDVGVIVADEVCSAAAVFTQNRFCGCPVTIGKEHLRNGRLRGIVVNSGCSNVATGKRGLADAREMCRLLAEPLDAEPAQILPASTGVIGRFLPMEKLRTGIAAALKSCSTSATAGAKFSRAIMTTDLKPKQALERVRVGKSVITVAGCCKGSGMIAPNMATMLAFLTTDAKLPPRQLQRLLREAVEPTFNRITVDECPSTSDTVTIMASGQSGEVGSGRGQTAFATALRAVCESLAYQVVKDGEGATRVLEIKVINARTTTDAHAAARAIAVSPLVKTAVHGGDPNWGRIIQALGTTHVTYDPNKVIVKLDDRVLFSRGEPTRDLDLKAVSRLMRRPHVPVTIDLKAGRCHDRVLTCDLSREYIAINADYTT